jgi:2-dehydropantoate 2-reductase
VLGLGFLVVAGAVLLVGALAAVLVTAARVTPDARPSMLLDRMAGRLSEIDAINGAIPPAAAALGLEAPENTVVSSLVRAIERGLGVRD